jgi:hypothetical protein
MELNTGCCCLKPATNRLSYGMAEPSLGNRLDFEKGPPKGQTDARNRAEIWPHVRKG